MELISIILSAPLAFVVCMFYCWLMARARRRTERIRRVLLARKRVPDGFFSEALYGFEGIPGPYR